MLADSHPRRVCGEGERVRHELSRKSIAVATVAAAATTAITAAAATAAIASATALARFARTGFVHRQTATVMILIIQRADGFLSLGVGAHLDETEATAAPGFSVGGDLRALNRSKLRKQLFEIRIRNLEGQITNVKPSSHRRVS